MKDKYAKSRLLAACGVEDDIVHPTIRNKFMHKNFSTNVRHGSNSTIAVDGSTEYEVVLYACK